MEGNLVNVFLLYYIINSYSTRAQVCQQGRGNMQIAFTADTHLASDQKHPERENALREILKVIADQNIQILIIAGDCFDRDFTNILPLEVIVKETKSDDLMIYLLPGNHDESIKQSFFSLSNIRVIETTSIEIIAGKKFLFVPYKNGRSMGEEIGRFENELKGESWILVGHGDLSSYSAAGTQYEPGMYMPLSKRDLNLFKPSLCLMGHIHKPIQEKNIYYPGSPCGLDITECGRRRIAILDIDNMQLKSQTIETEVIFLNESILITPSDDEIQQVGKEIDHLFEPYYPAEISKIKLRLNLFGYSFNRSTLVKNLEVFLKEKYGLKNCEIFSDEVQPANEDFVRQQISEKTINFINELDFGDGGEKKNQVMKEALKLIFGGRS
ncbi:MAG: hypothetical protein CVU39_26635 [Chloroflexi bacterium HGW-Chloroflexi-10]|nr:MAG: hypothetical protein CVU39_26635 [Chloroflexi bacterium HGW-Chloroflexi-10]